MAHRKIMSLVKFLVSLNFVSCSFFSFKLSTDRQFQIGCFPRIYYHPIPIPETKSLHLKWWYGSVWIPLPSHPFLSIYSLVFCSLNNQFHLLIIMMVFLLKMLWIERLPANWICQKCQLPDYLSWGRCVAAQNHLKLKTNNEIYAIPASHRTLYPWQFLITFRFIYFVVTASFLTGIGWKQKRSNETLQPNEKNRNIFWPELWCGDMATASAAQEFIM